jgi:tRNA A-37 threonylcarbamoyl transferase component Bud32
LKETIFLTNELNNLFSSRDFFSIAENLEGKVFRKTANRITKEFTFEGNRYFIKLHYGVGWKEIFKNIFKFRAPTIGASPEWKALKKLRSLGIECPEPVGFYSSGINPATLKSFLITRSLINTVSLEEALKKRKFQELSFSKKREFIEKIALISRNLHKSGINHRDYYLCHFHVDKDMDANKSIYLIDLHRAQLRSFVPTRWASKDIGGLIHSAMGFDLTEKDFYRFMGTYLQCSIRESLQTHSKFLKTTRNRAFRMFMKPILKEINIKDEQKENSTSSYITGKGEGRRWIAKKRFFNEGLSEVISNPDKFMSKGEEVKFEAGNHVVGLDLPNHSIFIKKFQIKGAFHYFRKVFSPTRAITAWKATHWLNAAGIKTINPLAVIEIYDSFTTTESYLITLKQSGERLDQMKITESLESLIPNKMGALIKRLGWIGFNHGDAKGSNFFFDKNSLIVSDLDACKRRIFQITLDNKLSKDKKRITKSFENHPKIQSSLLKRFN